MKKNDLFFGMTFAEFIAVPRGQQNCQEQISDGGLVDLFNKTASFLNSKSILIKKIMIFKIIS